MRKLFSRLGDLLFSGRHAEENGKDAVVERQRAVEERLKRVREEVEAMLRREEQIG